MVRLSMKFMACVVFSLVAAQPANAGFINGSFESPNLGVAQSGETRWMEFVAGGSTFPGWKVEAGSVDIQTTGGMPASTGPQYLDLNGSGPGTISQVMQANMGVTYKLSFD